MWRWMLQPNQRKADMKVWSAPPLNRKGCVLFADSNGPSTKLFIARGIILLGTFMEAISHLAFFMEAPHMSVGTHV